MYKLTADTIQKARIYDGVMNSSATKDDLSIEGKEGLACSLLVKLARLSRSLTEEQLLEVARKSGHQSVLDLVTTSFVLVEVDQAPGGNGLPSTEMEIAFSAEESRLVEFCREKFGKEVGKPEKFSWDNYFEIRPTKKIII